jgi:hypothetical protein
MEKNDTILVIIAVMCALAFYLGLAMDVPDTIPLKVERDILGWTLCTGHMAGGFKDYDNGTLLCQGANFTINTTCGTVVLLDRGLVLTPRVPKGVDCVAQP